MNGLRPFFSTAFAPASAVFCACMSELPFRRELCRRFFLELLHELQERHVKGETEIAQLHQVETTLAHLAFADIRLRAAQPLRQSVLRETGAFAGGAQKRQHQKVFGTMNRSADGSHPQGNLEPLWLKSITDLRTL